MRALKWLCLLFLALSPVLSGCGKIETEIRTRYPLDTNDTEGPYQVMAVVTGEPPLRVWLVYSTDNWKVAKNIKSTEMELASPDVFRGTIKGQKPGTTISYYILVQEVDNKVTTDPNDMAQAANKLTPKDKTLTYQFRVLK